VNPDVASPPLNGKPQLAPGPLFVVSMWRSGSSLLYALLNKHPQVGLMYEADLLLLKPVFLKPKAMCDWAERWQFWNNALARHGMSLSDVPEGIASFPAAFTAAHQLYAQRKGATIWGDKSPNYFDRLNEMADDFPHARFIIVWRDPNGTANSILRAASLGNSYFSRKGAAHCGLLGYAKFKQETDRLLQRGQAVCQVNYEDLIGDPPAAMRQVCDFLQIPYHDALSTLEGADRSAILPGEHHANLRGNAILRESRPALTDSALRQKLARYLAHWRRKYKAQWPPYPLPAAARIAPATLVQRLVDQLLYRLIRNRDHLSPLVFSWAPLSLLRRYRQSKTRRIETAAHPDQPGPIDCGGTSCAAAVKNGPVALQAQS
jgi:hypothetical protein